MSQPSQFETILSSLSFPEGPRWHNGHLYFSDFYQHEVVAVDIDGQRETIARIEAQPSGLGFRPDGTLLVVSMLDRRVLRIDERTGEQTEHADLSGLAKSVCNDMVVDGRGRAWVGNFGFERHKGESPRTTNLVFVDEDGTARVAAEDLFFPNGTVITEDHSTLIVAETYARRLSAFTIAEDGSLVDRRIWANLGETVPDGICLDQEGAIWVADPRGNEVVRFEEGGRVLERLSTGELGAYACMLGGTDGTTLFVCTCAGSGPEAAKRRGGRIEIREVEVAGTGSP